VRAASPGGGAVPSNSPLGPRSALRFESERMASLSAAHDYELADGYASRLLVCNIAVRCIIGITSHPGAAAAAPSGSACFRSEEHMSCVVATAARSGSATW
jgi:hypothetical protein